MSDALDRIRDIVGPKGWIADQAAAAPYLTDWRRLYRGEAALIVRPGSTEEVARVVAVCAEAGIGIVPMGGNTGLVGGAVPAAGQIVLATDRLDRIRSVDPAGDTITVEAGVILQRVQEAAVAVDRLFPLSLGAEGSCRIGGNLSTNAGGTAVRRYGNARELVLGLEVVLADGRVWDGLSALRKDNTGYDLKQLFIGAEGTLGIITAAVLRLFPRPREVTTALAAVADPAAALALLGAAPETLAAFELMPRAGLDLALAHVPGAVDPIAGRHPWYALIELTAPPGHMEALLAAGPVTDAVIADSEARRRALWHLREAIVEGQRLGGASLKHDVSVPVASVPAFIAEATAAVERALPGVGVVPFGHLGDGNIHFNLMQPEGVDPAAFLARIDEMATLIHDIVARYAGSFSAEHGIGLLKRAELAARKSPVALDLMRRVKAALDPKGIMNQGKVL